MEEEFFFGITTPSKPFLDKQKKQIEGSHDTSKKRPRYNKRRSSRRAYRNAEHTVEADHKPSNAHGKKNSPFKGIQSAQSRLGTENKNTPNPNK